MNEKVSVFDLQDAHKGLLGKYLTFFKSKQESFVKEIKLVIEDFKDSK